MKQWNRIALKIKTVGYLLVIVGILALLTLCFLKDLSFVPKFGTEAIPELEAVDLVRVVDGDTIIVLKDGQETRVRLIGINTPESVAPEGYSTSNTQEGILASEYTKELLSDVSVVYLEKDVSETDKYGRLLRYVWLEEPNPDASIFSEIETKMLNGILLSSGVAEEKAYPPDTKYQSYFSMIKTKYD